MSKDKQKPKPDEGKKEKRNQFPFRESYSPNKDDLDPENPPQGSGPKDEADSNESGNNDDNKE